jgi:ribonucleoside-diphosphate reductase beta chain
VLFDEMLRARVDRLASEPEDLETLVEAVTIYHMVVEGMLALTGQPFIMDYNERMGTLPAFVQGFTLVARDSTAMSPSGRGSCATWLATTRAT